MLANRGPRVFAIVSLFAAVQASHPAHSTVQTGCGLVSAVVEDRVSIFKGIPYAAPPIADRRWSAPESLEEAGLCWNGTLPAKSFGPACPQAPGSLDIGATSEDCLFLNVWTPNISAAAKLPVMVWVHGGIYFLIYYDVCFLI
jgi:para-nitrobenzyl esterase